MTLVTVISLWYFWGWIKQKIVGVKLCKDYENRTRLGPVLVFNMLFSIVLLNPYMLFGLGLLGIKVDDQFGNTVSNVLNTKMYEITIYL